MSEVGGGEIIQRRMERQQDSAPEAERLLQRWLSAWRAMELSPPRADLVADTSRFLAALPASPPPAADVEGLRPFLLHRVQAAIIDGLAEYARLSEPTA